MNTTKKLMTLLLALLGVTQVVAQEYEYVPLVREGVKWVCYYDNPINATEYEGSFIPYGQHFYTLELKGDTVINGKSYKPLHFYSGQSINEESDTVPVYLREENKIVYGIIPDETRYYECPIGIGTMVLDISRLISSIETGKEFVLYDYNDLESFYKNYDSALSFNPLLDEEFSASTDTVLIGNQLRKRLVIHSPYSWDEYIIEGLGYARNSLPGNPFNYFYGITTGVTQVIYNLCHVIENGKIVHRTPWCQHADPKPEPDDYEYVPLVREGVKWVYSIQDYRYEEEYETNPARGDNKIYRTLEIKGDTIINGKTYKAVHKCTDDVYSEPSDVIPLYLREEDKMVYGIVPDGTYFDDANIGYLAPWNEEIYSGEEFLLYDFQDPVTYWESIDQYYDIHLQVDTIEVGSRYSKRYFYENQWLGDFQVIEGIGATGMNSYPLAFLMPVGTGIHTTEYYNLEKVIENGEVIYPQNYMEDRYLPVIREGVKWVNVYAEINDGDTTYHYYTYEFKGNYPEKDSYNRTFKAVYSQNSDANGSNYGDERLVAGLLEDEACILSFRNEPLGWMTNFINFYTYQGNDDVRLLHENLEGMWDIDYYINNQSYPHMNLLNTDNFVKADPIMIDGMLCSRIAYIGEQGDTLAYIVEGIGFDSRDLGDLLTPFTRYPEADCGECYQEYCGLSHVIKDGKIIYKGMNYRPIVPGDVDGDGEVTIGDANSVIDIVVMGGNAGHTRIPEADVNGDGEVTVADVNAIIDMILRHK